MITPVSASTPALTRLTSPGAATKWTSSPTLSTVAAMAGEVVAAAAATEMSRMSLNRFTADL
jgi:hypothetical protein